MTTQHELTPLDLTSWRARRIALPSAERRGPKSPGWSKRELAEQLGVSPNTVSKWEAGLNPLPKWLPLALSALAEAEYGQGIKNADEHGFASQPISPFYLADHNKGDSTNISMFPEFGDDVFLKVDSREVMLRVVKAENSVFLGRILMFLDDGEPVADLKEGELVAFTVNHVYGAYKDPREI